MVAMHGLHAWPLEATMEATQRNSGIPVTPQLERRKRHGPARLQGGAGVCENSGFIKPEVLFERVLLAIQLAWY